MDEWEFTLLSPLLWYMLGIFHKIFLLILIEVEAID